MICARKYFAVHFDGRLAAKKTQPKKSLFSAVRMMIPALCGVDSM